MPGIINDQVNWSLVKVTLEIILVRIHPTDTISIISQYFFIISIADNRGFMTQNGQPDNPRSARYVLKDFVNGRLLYCVAPPTLEQKCFHTFPSRRRNLPTNRHVPPRAVRVNRGSHVTSDDLDRTFFQDKSSGVHVRGILGRQHAPQHSLSTYVKNTRFKTFKFVFSLNPFLMQHNQSRVMHARPKISDTTYVVYIFWTCTHYLKYNFLSFVLSGELYPGKLIRSRATAPYSSYWEHDL